MDAGRFRLSETVTSTLVGCPPEVMKQAADFGAALHAARTLRIDGKQLSLVGEGGAVLATLAAQRQDLHGTAWQVTFYNNGKQALVSVSSGSALTMEFSMEGILGGSAGCNRYTGPYSTEAGKVHVGSLTTTRKMCGRPEGVMEQEGAFLKALGATATARIDGDQLELRDAGGALTVMAVLPTDSVKPRAPGRD
jgi:heat shock protein HslJ